MKNRKSSIQFIKRDLQDLPEVNEYIDKDLLYFNCHNGQKSCFKFFEDVKAISNVVTNSFALTFKVGGTTAPSLELAMGTAHVDIPTHSIEDVISLETNFNALPSSIELTDEVVLTYKGA